MKLPYPTIISEDEEVKKVIKQNQKERQRESNLKFSGGFITEKITLPIEEKIRFDQEYERINSYVDLKESKLDREFNKKDSVLKKVGNFLYQKLYDFPDVAKSEVAKQLSISILNVEQKISKLNFYNKYPLTIIPVTNKKGYVQAITRDEEDALRWERRKFRTIESMSHIKDKGTLLMKKFTRNKERKKIIIKNEPTKTKNKT